MFKQNLRIGEGIFFVVVVFVVKVKVVLNHSGKKTNILVLSLITHLLASVTCVSVTTC